MLNVVVFKGVIDEATGSFAECNNYTNDCGESKSTELHCMVFQEGWQSFISAFGRNIGVTASHAFN